MVIVMIIVIIHVSDRFCEDLTSSSGEDRWNTREEEVPRMVS